MTCFNGATAVKPWMGSMELLVDSASYPTLQWGHGGEAVDGREYLESKERTSGLLQWGHGGEAVDGSLKARPSMRSFRLLPLQWGHGGEAVDGGADTQADTDSPD